MPKGKEMTIAVTEKTPDGQIVTRPYHVTGPIQLCLVPIAPDPNKGVAYAIHS
ncbi:MAG: hypothetical protein AB1798_12305 [Spirochaetota bacterium]